MRTIIPLIKFLIVLSSIVSASAFGSSDEFDDLSFRGSNWLTYFSRYSGIYDGLVDPTDGWSDYQQVCGDSPSGGHGYSGDHEILLRSADLLSCKAACAVMKGKYPNGCCERRGWDSGTGDCLFKTTNHQRYSREHGNARVFEGETVSDACLGGMADKVAASVKGATNAGNDVCTNEMIAQSAKLVETLTKNIPIYGAIEAANGVTNKCTDACNSNPDEYERFLECTDAVLGFTPFGTASSASLSLYKCLKQSDEFVLILSHWTGTNQEDDDGLGVLLRVIKSLHGFG